MGIVGRGNVDDVNRRIDEHVLRIIVHLGDAIALCKGHGFRMGPVAHTVKGASQGLQRLRQLVADDPDSIGGPVVLYCHSFQSFRWFGIIVL